MSDDLAPQFDPKDLQWAAIAVADAWSEHDATALARLTPEQRREQYEARWTLLQFVDTYREAAKLTHDQAVYHAPEWQVVAGMKDLLEQMTGDAEEARAVAGDPDD